MQIDSPLRLEIKSTSHNSLEPLPISGYASVFNNIDSYNDIVTQGAFNDSIKQHYQGKTIKLLWQHEATQPIGFINTLKEDQYGLYIEASIIRTTRQGNEAIELIKQKAINGLSIGFNILKSHFNEKGNRIITQLDLWEISLVTFPANPSSVIKLAEQHNYKQFYQALIKAELSLQQLNRA